MAPSVRFSLRTFGGFELNRDAMPCDLAYEKGRALLAYLAAEPGRSHSRASLAAMFWPDLEREAALTNLRQVLHNLRQTFTGADPERFPLQADRESIRLDPDGGLEIDAALFSTPLPACPVRPYPAHCDLCLAQMETLAARYRGEFMAGFSLPECLDFEAWLQIHREALHLRALVLLTRLSDCHERVWAYGKALPFAQQFLRLEPWNEDGLRRVMRLLALNGQRASALAQYTASCTTLKSELDIVPSEETTALAQRIRQGELLPTAKRAADACPVPDLPLAGAEWRQVSVLYCELVSAGVEDPDETLVLLRTSQAQCNEIIRAYSGHLVHIHGGSLLAYFGYPQARENAARLAVQAALAVTRAKFPGIDLHLGIHTGMVISGGVPQVPDAIGATSGLAIRLCQRAAHGELLISEATQRLVAGYFECVSLGRQALSGGTRTLELFSVLRRSEANDRLEAAAKLTPLVGRKNEIKILRTLWNEACRGSRRVVLIRGEAGIGKSRLVLSLKEGLREKNFVIRELRCFPEYSQSPFHPLTVLFEFMLAFSPEDTPESRFDRLVEYVEKNFAKTDQNVVPLLARMLSLPLRAPYREPLSSPQQQREKTLTIMRDRYYALARERPVLLIVEDLHWADPSTLELLDLLLVQDRAVPILIILTARPEFKPSWREDLACTLSLGALGNTETAALIGAVAPEISPARVFGLVERADGIPLFAEELAREFAANDQSSIPSSLRDLLTTRLDSMGAAKTAAQSAATIGREFGVNLLRQISDFDDATLKSLLHQLQAARLIQGAAEGVFNFRHALIRDAAYQSQTRTEREAIHRRIASALKTSGSEVRPELLAQHWAACGEILEAINCWLRAGRLANQYSASQEAITHFKSGLALVEVLPAAPDRERLELSLQIGLGAAASSAQGYASAEGAKAYARAMALCGRHESNAEMFPAIWGLWASASSRTGYADAIELAQQLLRLASLSSDPVHHQQSCFAVANTLYWQGKFVVAREYIERISLLYRPLHHESHVTAFGEDAGVTSGSYHSWVLWFLGFPDQARQVSAQTLALARQLGHPFSLAYALTFAAILHCRLRQSSEIPALAQETLNLANSHGFSLWQIGARISNGWALAMQKRSEGIEEMQQCVAATRAAMGGVTLVVLEPLIDACVVLDCFDAALDLNDEAMALGKAIGDCHVEAELHRLRGESLLGRKEANETEAEACFHQALAVSRHQQAKSLELRAAMSMARLWQRQGKADAARRLLEAIYGWFSEGFDTPDLQDARSLLESLAGPAKVRKHRQSA